MKISHFFVSTFLTLIFVQDLGAAPPSPSEAAALAEEEVLVDVESFPFDEVIEEKIAERARARTYPGGADESDLKVQELLPDAPRRVWPITLQKEVLGSIVRDVAEEGPQSDEEQSE